MLKLIVALFIGFQIMSVTHRSAAETVAVAGSTMLAFVAVPGRLRRRQRAEAAFDEVEGDKIDDNLQYGAWGEPRDGNTFGKSTPFGFTGRWGGYSDARLGQVLNWHRWYGPSAGRWMSKDPIGIAGGVNLFSYVSNRVQTFVDSSGLTATKCCKQTKADCMDAVFQKFMKTRNLINQALGICVDELRKRGFYQPWVYSEFTEPKAGQEDYTDYVVGKCGAHFMDQYSKLKVQRYSDEDDCGKDPCSTQAPGRNEKPTPYPVEPFIYEDQDNRVEVNPNAQ